MRPLSLLLLSALALSATACMSAGDGTGTTRMGPAADMTTPPPSGPAGSTVIPSLEPTGDTVIR